MASLKQEPVVEPTPIQLQHTPDPIRHLIPMATVTITEPNLNSDEPPMGVPLLLPPSVPAPSTRRLPPPCWTPDETSCLIDAYRDKWYSLKRGNLRAPHWQDVADQIHLHCPHVSPPKTAVQCRHKMEKLRKRYRAELLRANSIPHHRFSSSWVYFYKMDSMEKSASTASLPSPHPISQAPALPNPLHFNTLTPPAAAAAAAHDDGVDDDDDDNDVTLRSYQQPRNGFTARNYQHPDPHRTRVPPPTHSNRTHPPTYADFDSPPPPPVSGPNYGFKSNYPLKSGYTNNYGAPTPPPPSYNGGGGGVSGSRFVKSQDNISNSGSPRMEMNYMNVNSNNKKKRKMSDGEEKKEREEEAAMEMVEAIRMLGEGFVRMEKMKMDMMRETERMRMEMEMKRTQMLLESQHRIVEAFAKGWADVTSSKQQQE